MNTNKLIIKENEGTPIFCQKKTWSATVMWLFICKCQTKQVLKFVAFDSKRNFYTQVYFSTHFHVNISNLTHF
jgi:hypothetical protein